VSVDPFPPNSRYRGIATAQWTAPGGREIVYMLRRFVPDPARLATAGQVAVRPGDRADLIAAAQLGDPELAWRLCDGNGAMRPEELTAVVGRLLRVTLPEGMPGVPGA
jgi:hypothetical protein